MLRPWPTTGSVDAVNSTSIPRFARPAVDFAQHVAVAETDI